MKFLGLSLLIFLNAWQTCECHAIQSLKNDCPAYPKAEIFTKYRFRHIYSYDSHNQHQIMGSGALGKEGIEDLSCYLAKQGMDPLKTIIYIHKEGFHKTEENGAFAQEELDYSTTKQINFLHPYIGTHKLYIDGLNPLQTNHQLTGSNFDRIFGTYSKFTDKTIEPIDLSGGREALYQTLSLALNKELQPVLIHCRAGRHRTAMVQMILRYLEGGIWVNSSRKHSGVFRAKKDKNNLTELHDLLPLEYEYFYTADPKARIENIEFIRDFMYNKQHSLFRKSLQKLYKDSL